MKAQKFIRSKMYALRLCETREYDPRILEHWLCTMQKKKTELKIIFAEKNGKVEIFTSEDMADLLTGSTSKKTNYKRTTGKGEKAFFIKQPKGPLLPIKRSAQFEDRTNKTRIYPSNFLINEISKNKDAFIEFKFKPIQERKRRKALKKSKLNHFRPNRKIDQWESKTWFRIWIKHPFRRTLGPLLRKTLTNLRNYKTEHEEKTQEIHEREDTKTATLDKLARPLFRTEIKMSHPFNDFIQGFSLPYLGQLSISKRKSALVLSAEELSSICSFPNPKDVNTKLHTESTAHLPPPENPMEISEKDRRRHLYLLGKTGMGKSTTILHLIEKDVKRNRSVILIDPHGDLAEEVLEKTPRENRNKIIFLDPSAEENPLALNPVELKKEEKAHLKSSALIEMFEALSKGSWGPRLEYILRNALLTLILAPNTTLLDLPRLLTKESFTKNLARSVNDEELNRFWDEEFLPQNEKTRREQISPILNKVGPLITSPLLRNIFGQPRGKFNFKKAFDEKKIVLISLSKGKIGQDAGAMLGMIFISMIHSTLINRANISPENRNTVSIYIDEFQNFNTPTLLSLLAECRKYGLALTIANQYLTQLKPEIQDAVLGNVGSIFSFRLSHEDAKKIAPTFNLTEEDLCNLAPFRVYGKILKNSETQPVFRWETPKPISTHEKISREEISTIKEKSAIRFGTKKRLVEEKIIKKYNARKLNCAK